MSTPWYTYDTILMDTGICFALACKVIDGGAGCRTILFKTFVQMLPYARYSDAIRQDVPRIEAILTCVFITE